MTLRNVLSFWKHLSPGAPPSATRHENLESVLDHELIQADAAHPGWDDDSRIATVAGAFKRGIAVQDLCAVYGSALVDVALRQAMQEETQKVESIQAELVSVKHRRLTSDDTTQMAEVQVGSFARSYRST